MWKKYVVLFITILFLAGCTPLPGTSSSVDGSSASNSFATSAATASSGETSGESQSQPGTADPFSADIGKLDDTILDQIWNQLSGTEGTVDADAFSQSAAGQGVRFLEFTKFELYQASAGEGSHAILLRNRETSEWQQLDMGEYYGQGITWMYEDSDDPYILNFKINGSTQYPDGHMWDFPSRLAYDARSHQLRVAELYNNQSGKYGGTSWTTKLFRSPSFSENAVCLSFEAAGSDTNDYRSPGIELEYQPYVTGREHTYILRFHKVEQNLVPQDLSQIAAFEGVDSFLAEYFDISGFSGTVWTFQLKEGYRLDCSFQHDFTTGDTHNPNEGYSSFTVAVQPDMN